MWVFFGSLIIIATLTNAFAPNHAATNTIISNQDLVQESSKVQVEYGDSKGAALLLDNVAISRGSEQILKRVCLRVEPSQRWAIVGSNGVGKSTLLGAITGTVSMDEGKATVAPNLRVGYLKQSAVAGSNKTVYDEAASQMFDINNARKMMESLEKQIAQGDSSPELLEQFDKASTDFNSAGGWTQAQEVDTVLKGLGFQASDSSRKCSEFSGGWKMRIALARLLLSKPKLLLLDEPSNHLDISARNWLANYLASYEDSLILVSHDKKLIQSGVNNIAEIIGNTLNSYVSCTYDKYLETKEFRSKSAIAEFERNVAEAARLQAYIDKWGASATKASSAQSRKKMLEKMKKEGKLTPPSVSITQKAWTPVINLLPAPKSVGEVLLSLSNANIGYDDSEPLLKDIDVELCKGMKVVLRGENGSGKSTLMATLRGELPLLSGERVVNDRLKLGIFTQDLAQQLDTSSRAVDIVTEYARGGDDGDITISDQQARNAMGGLGLSQDKALRKVGDLSGGEKGKVALAMFAMKASNVLFLDEPSNHLDQATVKALALALSSWDVTNAVLVVISHDRRFCDEIGFTHVGSVKDGSLVLEERSLGYQDWNGLALSGSVKNSNSKEDNQEMTQKQKEEDQKRRKKIYNAPKRISKLEGMIEKAETRIAQIEETMLEVATDVGKLLDLTKEKELEQNKIAMLMDEWEDLELLLSET